MYWYMDMLIDRYIDILKYWHAYIDILIYWYNDILIYGYSDILICIYVTDIFIYWYLYIDILICIYVICLYIYILMSVYRRICRMFGTLICWCKVALGYPIRSTAGSVGGYCSMYIYIYIYE